MYLGRIRSVRDISRDDRARIATCSLRTTTDRQTDILMENYSIDLYVFTLVANKIHCSYHIGSFLSFLSLLVCTFMLTLTSHLVSRAFLVFITVLPRFLSQLIPDNDCAVRRVTGFELRSPASIRRTASQLFPFPKLHTVSASYPFAPQRGNTPQG